MDETNELLSQILAELIKQKEALGFGHPPRHRYVYANRQYSDCLWYFWNGAKNEHEPIEFHALTGKITKLEIEESEFRGRNQAKVSLHVEAERRYVVQAGFDTLFSKGLLSALDKLPVEVFSRPLTIAVEPGDTEQVLFCRVYDAAGQPVFAPYEEPINWQQIALRVARKISPDTPELEIKQQPAISPEPLEQEVADPAGEWEIEPFDASEVIAKISVEMGRAGWDKKRGSEYLQRRYGKKTRAELEPHELRSFLRHLEKQASAQNLV